MAHFAKIDPDTNLVLAVHVVNNSDCLDLDGVEQESIGQAFLEKSGNWPAANWIKTSYNTKLNQYWKTDGIELADDQSKAFRGNFAGIGYEWDSTNQIFWPEKPHASWVKNISTAQWESPVGPKPNLTSEQINSTTHDYVREWDESTTSWNIIETPKQPALTSEQKNSTTHDYLYEWNEGTGEWDFVSEYDPDFEG